MWSKRILIYFILIIGILISLFHVSEWLWPELWGSRSLGNNLYLINWEKGAKFSYIVKIPEGTPAIVGLMSFRPVQFQPQRKMLEKLLQVSIILSFYPT